MSERLKKYLDGVFSPYEDLKQIRELKEELYNDLQEKLNDLKSEGYDDESAYDKTIHSIGNISELVESINAKTVELQQLVGMDLSKSVLKDADFREIKVHDGKFNYSNLKGADFSGSDLSCSSFKCSNLDGAKFDGANLTNARLNKSNLKHATFRGAILDNTNFSSSELSGVCFDGMTLNGTDFTYSGLRGTSFRNAVLKNVSFKTEVRKSIFDGATMDKLTYALLKGFKARLDNVTVI